MSSSSNRSSSDSMKNRVHTRLNLPQPQFQGRASATAKDESSVVKDPPAAASVAATDGDAISPFLEQGVRRETSDFDFDTLLKGVSTRKDDSPERSRPSFLPGAPQDTPVAASVPGPPARRRIPVVALLALGVAAVLIMGFLALAGRNSGNGNTAVERQRSASVTADSSSTQARKPGQPDPALTPGHRQDTVRAGGAIPQSVREQVFQSYGIDLADKKHVLVRLIPVSLGGTEEPANLFPTTPWFLELKTRLDKQLAEKVSRGEMGVEQAVGELKADWIAAAHRHHVRNYGHNDKDAARQTESKLNWYRNSKDGK